MSRPAAPLSAGVVRFYRYDSGDDGFREEVLAGLAGVPKSIPARHRCDDNDETSLLAQAGMPGDDVEHAILRAHAAEITALLGPENELVVFHPGATAGTAACTRVLIDAARPSLCIPVDRREARLKSSVAALAADFPELNICALAADCARPIVLPDFIGVPVRRRSVYCPGAVIGEFAPDAARAFLGLTRDLLRPGGILLIGVGMKHPPRDGDSEGRGLGAELGRRVLGCINRELGGDFRVDRFRPEMRYDAARGCVDMWLTSVEAQTAHIAGRSFDIASGEALRAGAIWRYNVDEFRTLAAAAGFHPLQAWTDADGLSSMHALLAL